MIANTVNVQAVGAQQPARCAASFPSNLTASMKADSIVNDDDVSRGDHDRVDTYLTGRFEVSDCSTSRRRVVLCLRRAVAKPDPVAIVAFKQ